jgi:putative membrane protein
VIQISRKIKIIGVVGLHLLLVSAAFFTVYVPFKSNFSIISTVFVVLVFIPTGYSFVRWLGLKIGVTTLGILFILAISIEALALMTGVPYGDFVYTQKAGLSIFNRVPLVVPFAWSTILLGCSALTVNTKPLWKKILITTGAVVVVDIILDPVAVSLGLWFWKAPGFYYGVPLVNFIGWMGSGLLGVSVLECIAKKFSPTAMPARLAISLYCLLVVWLSIALFKFLVIPLGIGILFLFFCRKRMAESFNKLVYE